MGARRRTGQQVLDRALSVVPGLGTAHAPDRSARVGTPALGASRCTKACCEAESRFLCLSLSRLVLDPRSASQCFAGNATAVEPPGLECAARRCENLQPADGLGLVESHRGALWKDPRNAMSLAERSRTRRS